ncbi:MAG: nitroreductase family protein [Candidatus Bathyarchaeota archaeon]|nr:nitroreductase family protein [Candidatus Bathyarchaeota archaeon]
MEITDLSYETIINRRTTRKFQQKPVAEQVLRRCVDAARLSPSGSNRQPLKYVIVNTKDQLQKVFKATRWAGSLPEYYPSDDEAPMAYIAILLDTTIRESPAHDAGIAAMSISLVAYDAGIASCMLGGIDRGVLRDVLKVPEHLNIILLVALGYAAEKQVAEVAEDGNIKYWLDENGVIHVPKRSLDEILQWNTCAN